MPEGDTIAYAANRIRPVLAGRVPDEIETPQGGAALPSLRKDDRGPRPGRCQPHDILVSGMPELGSRLRRVGHKGADLIAPGNTHASFDAALAAGVDMIEFDVLPEDGGERLLLAHDRADAAQRVPHTLEEGLLHLATEAFTGIELDVDLKLPGYELRVLDALRSAEMLDRALISSQYRESLAVIRAAEPGVRLGWSVPKLSRDPFRSRALTLPALAALHTARAILPARAARALRGRVCDALMVHWRLVTPRLARSVHAAGGELYVWTVDDLGRLQALEALGVTGVITNDPRLFAALDPQRL